MVNIDPLLEKYLIGFKKYGKIVDIYENPTKKELREIGKDIRWIADSKRQKVYMWPAIQSIHLDAWLQIKKELNDSRPLYKSDTIMTGVTFPDGRSVMFSAKAYGPEARARMRQEDWSFTSRYFDIEDIFKTFN